jgi:hypothetical protein
LGEFGKLLEQALHLVDLLLRVRWRLGSNHGALDATGRVELHLVDPDTDRLAVDQDLGPAVPFEVSHRTGVPFLGYAEQLFHIVLGASAGNR